MIEFMYTAIDQSTSILSSSTKSILRGNKKFCEEKN